MRDIVASSNVACSDAEILILWLPPRKCCPSRGNTHEKALQGARSASESLLMLMTAHYRALALCKCTIASVLFHNVRYKASGRRSDASEIKYYFLNRLRFSKVP